MQNAHKQSTIYLDLFIKCNAWNEEKDAESNTNCLSIDFDANLLMMNKTKPNDSRVSFLQIFAQRRSLCKYLRETIARKTTRNIILKQAHVKNAALFVKKDELVLYFV